MSYNSGSMIQVDPDKLKNALAKRGVKSMNEANRICGYSSAAIEWAIKQRHMTKVMANLLNAHFQITPEEFAPDEPKKEPQPAPEPAQAAPATPAMTESQLYAVLKTGIYDALKEFSEVTTETTTKFDFPTDKIYDCVNRAVADAINTTFKANAKELRGLMFAAIVNGVRMTLREDLRNDK